MAGDQNHRRTERLQIMLDDHELRAIDDWRFANRMPSRAAAIRELLRRGLSVRQDESPEPIAAKSTDFSVVVDKPLAD